VKFVATGREPSVSPDRIELSDETCASIRPIEAADAEALVRFHAHLSRHSVELRFFYPHVELCAAEVAHFTQVDGRDRVAFVAERLGELVAVARYERVDEPAKAEVAFVVADEFQHQGIATALLTRLAGAARSADISQFSADVLVQNVAMLRVFTHSGFAVDSKMEAGTVHLCMEISSRL
jgi:RimJ/RimL family protein N-acetyltransferase